MTVNSQAAAGESASGSRGASAGTVHSVNRKFYADRADRRIIQLLVDAFFLLLTYLGWRVGSQLGDSMRTAQDGAKSLEKGTGKLSSDLTQAATKLKDVPLVGQDAAKPFQDAAGSAGDLSSSGHDLADGLGRTAMLVGPLLTLLIALLLFILWYLTRGRFVRRASRVTMLGQFPEGEKMLALEAKMTLSPKVWRDRPESELPNLLRRHLGLRPKPAAAAADPVESDASEHDISE